MPQRLSLLAGSELAVLPGHLVQLAQIFLRYHSAMVQRAFLSRWLLPMT
jgi:hypothetical protein